MSKEVSIKIYVKLYATLTKYIGRSIMHEPMEVELVKGATLTALYHRLGIPGDEVKTAFVNSKMQSDDYVLCDGDHVGVFPPVGGGCS
ncbi:MoaD/ThiS family protein [Candidatus Poribacteria bacterium]|nr:MoaD/ThiS family protein [Candidatus Poribacteria bacterium]